MHLILLYIINHNIWQEVQIIALLLYSFLQPFFTASLFGHMIYSIWNCFFTYETLGADSYQYNPLCWC